MRYTKLLSSFLLTCLLASCAKQEFKKFDSLAQLNSSSCEIGYDEGHSAYEALKEGLPQAKLRSFSNVFSGYEAVKQGKIDGFAFDRLQMELAIQEGLSGVRLLEDDITEPINVAVGLSPASEIPELESKINAFLAELSANGTLADIKQRWINRKSEEIPEIKSAENPTCHLCVGTTGIVQPYSYYKGTELTGLDIELARRFALWLNASLEFKIYDYASIVAAALSGEIDCIMANLNVTEERREKIAFSTPLYSLANAIMVRDFDHAESATSASLKDVPPQFHGMKLKYNSIEEMAKQDKLVIGMHTGFVMVDKLARQMLPNAKIEYYKTTPDLSFMTASGKIDGFINDEPIIRYAALEVPGLAYIHCGLEPMNIVVCFPKSDKGASLRDEFNVYVRKWREDGTLKKIDDLWLSNDEDKKVIDLSNLKGSKGTLRLGTEANCPPFEYLKDGKYAGYEIDLIARFCREAGYALEIQEVPFDSLIMGLESGMYDFAAACLSETPAHKESTNVSEAVYLSELVMAVQILDNGNAQNVPAYKTLADLNKEGVNIGIQTGTTFSDLVDEFFPKAGKQFYNSNTDMAHLIALGKLDAAIEDEPVAKSLCSNIKGITYIKDYVEKAEFAFALPKSEKGEKLKKQLDEFIKKSKKNGVAAELEEIWFGDDESKKTIDFDSLTGENGRISLATNAEYAPFEYIQDNKIIGYDIDWAVRFAKEYGYKLDIEDMNFDALITSIASQKYDFAVSGISVTEERKQSVHFSEPNYEGGAVVVVKDSSFSAKATSSAGWFDSLKSSFEKTFVRESRWKLIISGIGITVLISILSAIFGTILGFLICALRMSGNKIVNGASLTYIRIMQGMPMVVLLMILFYIVFAKTGIPGVMVAVIGFGMNFGAYVSEMIRTGILAVDKGQMEAALALGYTKPHAFIKVVLPQAARHFLPVFQGEFISLVKMTSIVGYIAIQDLTKAGDIIRSRTYEAFFPLVTTAIIYFIISWILTRTLVSIQNRLDPKKRRAKAAKNSTEEASHE